MKVYSKKEDIAFKTSKIVGFLMGLLFSVGPIVFVYLKRRYFFLIFDKDMVVGVSTYLPFFGLFIYGGISMMILALKKPVLCSAKLLSKNKENYLDKEITYMTFEICYMKDFKCEGRRRRK